MLVKYILNSISETLKVFKMLLHWHKWVYSSENIKGCDFKIRECKCDKKQIKTRLPICHIGNKSYDDNKWLTY